ncbi:hypothetical protein PAXRUDRAFT_11801 [Paxillus rubicundulus Ve08.2h10]|uniref:Uncharacterized protein n=1 Tax=Paxillus rubicundulus Ve08.2h10 TaxID=930991 RepID=A0A0D0DCB5_9AGAM|nr:hypothetical protein PAXRUDRAFT_11801 [Paxillus rubicundulus Ve08.2h10]
MAAGSKKRKKPSDSINNAAVTQGSKAKWLGACTKLPAQDAPGWGSLMIAYIKKA